MTQVAKFASTKTDQRPAAIICRERGWEPGQHLIGDEGYGPNIIRITAVGEAAILARCVFHGGKPDTQSRENTWTLRCRDWQPCAAPVAANFAPGGTP
jgi:hypothetical protein